MHESVLVAEVVDLLAVKDGGTYVDGTVGSGGHSLAILERAGERGRLLGIDRDEEALDRARTALAGHEAQVTLVHGNFADMVAICRESGFEHADGILLDVGVSSEQLTQPERGFSFNESGPLDMRMDRSAETTAADLVRDLPEEVLCKVFRENGDEHRARRIASAIVRARGRSPIVTTSELAAIVSDAVGGRRGRLHPATKVFQALRIAVNQELSSLETALPAGLSTLGPGGRMAVISFHSKEDGMVKRYFKVHAGRWESLPEGGSVWRGETPKVKIVSRKAVRPGDEEIRRNPRARSARLRVAEKI